VAKAEAAKEEILEDYPDAKLDVICLDNANLSSVREFADAFTEKYDRLDLLVNNAGIMAVPYSNTTDGFEVQWQTNHLSHFLLTKLLWETMVVKTPGQSRVIQHSSGAHHMGSPYFNKDHMEKPQHSAMGWPLWHIVAPYMMKMPTWNWLRYGVSKVSNVLFMRGLEKRIKEKNLEDKIISVAVHPGYAKTKGAHKAMGNLATGTAQSAADGSLPLLMACVSNEVVNGDYLGPKDNGKGPPVKDKVGGYGNDKKQASDLWVYSEECIGEKFEI
jgi:NAD(P)-dependent dehydrogenase (short-subunit alcohol dehydrogenase family)